MITPSEIVKKAGRQYSSILKNHLNGTSSFPLEFPVGKLPESLPARRRGIEQLRERSKEEEPLSYSIRWKEVNQRQLGRQTVPTKIIVETIDDYLALLRKKIEFNQFVQDVRLIRSRRPELEPWLHQNVKTIIAQHGRWGDLLSVCHFFVNNSPPYGYIRELPIPVHTKFIERHAGVLSGLLETLLPPDRITSDGQTFIKRFGLRGKPTPIRIRLLEAQLDWHYGLRLDDIALPADQLDHLLREHIKPKRVYIVENLINLLTLPRRADSIALFGRGYAIHLLKEISWLGQAELIYWGDIDADGFQILSDLRRLFPHARSLMMDQQTLDDNKLYVVEGRGDGRERAERFEHLTESERMMADHVVEKNIRLEQEHIPHHYVVQYLNNT